MNTDTLEFPKLDLPVAKEPAPPPEPASNRLQLATLDVQAVALSRFGAWRPAAAALVAKHKGVEFTNLDTGKGYRALTEAIAEVRAPRFLAQNVSKASKSELAAASKAVGAEEADIAAFLKPTEDHLVAQKNAHDEKVEKARREAAEANALRQAKHRERIATMRGYVDAAEGLPAARIAAGIVAFEAIKIDPAAWEEFAEEATSTHAATLAALIALHAKTAKQEADDAERLRVAEAQRVESTRLKAVSDKLEADRAEFEAQQMAAQPKPAPEPEPEPAAALPADPEPVEAEPAAPPAPPVAGTSPSPVVVSKASITKACGAMTLEDATPAELRNEWAIFEAALELVQPSIDEYAADIDRSRFVRAADRMRSVFGPITA